MVNKKRKYTTIAQVGNWVDYKSNKYRILSIEPETNVFNIEVNGKVIPLKNDGDYSIWE